MKPHEQRVVAERDEVSARLEKLTDFIANNPLFDGLPKEEQERLRAQAGVMKLYADILFRRIENFPRDPVAAPLVAGDINDSTPLTEEWLLRRGFRRVPSDLGSRFRDHLANGDLTIWEFNNTGEWLWKAYDSLSLRTRGDLRKLAALLNVQLLGDVEAP
jgi:hypothetical protein